MKKLFLSSTIKISGQVLGIGLSVLIARLFSQFTLGEYELLIRISQFLVIVMTFGFEKLLLRGDISFNDNTYLNHFELRKIAIKFLRVILCVVLLTYTILSFTYEGLNHSINIGAIILASITSINLLNGSTLAVQDKYPKYLFFSEIVYKLIQVSAFLAVVYIIKKKDIDWVIFIVIISSIIILLINYFGINNNSSKSIKINPKIIPSVIKEITPMAMVTLIYSIIIVGINLYIAESKGLEEVAKFSISLRVVAVTSLPMILVSNLIGTKIKNYHDTNDIDEINKLLRKYNLLFMLGSFAFMILVIVFGKMLLGLWGLEMVQAYNLLFIMAVGQCFNLLTGVAGPIYNMIGLQKINFLITFFSYSSFFLILYIFKISILQEITILFSITVAIENITKAVLLKSKTRINTIYYG